MSNHTYPDSTEIATLRDEYPSGLRVLMQHESVGYLLDALLDMPGTEFNKSRLADHAGVSRQSVHTHMPLLVTLGIVTEVAESDPVTYTLTDDDEIVRLLYQLEGLVNQRLTSPVEE